MCSMRSSKSSRPRPALQSRIGGQDRAGDADQGPSVTVSGGLALFDELDEPVLLVAQPLEQAGKARLQRLGDQPALGAAARFAGFDEKHGEIGGQRGVGIPRGLRLAQCPGEIVVPLPAVGLADR